MVKILSQAGNSLADIYEVVGSIAGIEQLETRELPIVHELGGTVFSERFSQDIRRAQTAALAQNTAWDVVITALGDNAIRVFGLAVHTSVTARVAFCSVSVNREVNGREVPIWIWDATPDIEINVRYSDNGAAAATTIFLRPVQLLEGLPNLMTGEEQPAHNNRIAFRGVTSGFGAGTVIVTMDVLTGFGQIQGGLTGRGLPFPSW